MAGTFASDVSSYQVPVNDSYRNPWLIFRACDGTWRDSNFAANLAWAKKACASGKLYGYTVYAVYEPGVDTLGTVKAMVGAPDGHITVMIDVESWSGKIRGDHSTDITALYRALSAWLGDERRVIAYGNQGDLATLYPHRPAAERLIVASYGSTKPTVPGQIGWQYSDGQATYPVPAGYPRNAAPFGPSDQNHFDLDPAALAAALGVGADIVTPDEIAKIAAAVWAEPFHAVKKDGKTPASGNHPAWVFLTNGSSAASVLPTIASLSGQIAGLTAAVKQLASGGHVDLTAVSAAAKSGAQSALDGYTLHIDPPAATP